MFPSVHAANPPLSLLEVLAEIMPQESLPDPIWIHHPLHLNNIPDTDLARVLVSSLARVHEGLCSLYNTPDAVLPRHQWLQLILEVVALVHEGLCNVQLASPLAASKIANSDAFDHLDGDEVALMMKIYEILGWLTDFSKRMRIHTVMLFAYTAHAAFSRATPPSPLMWLSFHNPFNWPMLLMLRPFGNHF
jgi:hypothetical protein